MEEKKIAIWKCWVRAFGMYALLSFGWTAILSFGMKLTEESARAASQAVITNSGVNSEGIIEFSSRLVKANGAFALFAAVFGFSFLIFRVKTMSQTAKRSIHIIANYLAAMVCTYIVHTTSSAETNAAGWVSMAVIWTFIFFIIYGIAAVVSYFAGRKKTAE